MREGGDEDSLMQSACEALPAEFSMTSSWESSASTSFGPTDPMGLEILKLMSLSFPPGCVAKSPRLTSKYFMRLRKVE